jgi:hypothetical protein
VGIAFMLLIAVVALMILCSAAPSDASSGDLVFDLVGLGFALFAFACLRWIAMALGRWRSTYNNWKPPHHENPHQ